MFSVDLCETDATASARAVTVAEAKVCLHVNCRKNLVYFLQRYAATINADFIEVSAKSGMCIHSAFEMVCFLFAKSLTLDRLSRWLLIGRICSR